MGVLRTVITVRHPTMAQRYSPASWSPTPDPDTTRSGGPAKCPSLDALLRVAADAPHLSRVQSPVNHDYPGNHVEMPAWVDSWNHLPEPPFVCLAMVEISGVAPVQDIEALFGDNAKRPVVV